MISMTVGRQTCREQPRQVVGADRQQRHEDDAGGQGADVQTQREKSFDHRVPEFVLAVGDGDGFDEGGHRRRPGPQADDQADRTTSAWPLFRMVSTVLPTRLSATSSLKMVCRKTVVCLRTSVMVAGPNSRAT